MQYFLTTMPGLAKVMQQDLILRLPESKIIGQTRTRHNDIVITDFKGDISRLHALRLVEDVYVSIGEISLTGAPVDLKSIEKQRLWLDQFRAGLNYWSEYTNRPIVKRLEFRVVVQADDALWRKYRRNEIMLAAERAIMRTNGSFRLNRDEAPCEVWLQQVDRKLLVSIRLSTSLERQHGGRLSERAAALRPSVAAALVFLSCTEDQDVFLDPMAGSGTILLERAAMGRYKFLLGGDIDHGAVKSLQANFGPRHKPHRLEMWDARHLPLNDGSVTKLVTNLPWGRQIGNKDELPGLYHSFLREAHRVLRPDGKIVSLTSEWKLFKVVYDKAAGFRDLKVIPNVEILGRRADIFTATRE